MLRNRAGLLIAFALIALLGALSYAGSSAPVVLYRLITDGATVAAWLIAAAGFGSVTLGWVDSNGRPRRLLRSVAAVGLGLGAIGLMTLALGYLRWLNRATAIGIIGAGLALAVTRLLRKQSPNRRRRSWIHEPAGWEWLWLVASPFAAIALVAAIVPPGILWRHGDPSYYDVLEYHLQVPREWFEGGRIVPLYHNVFSFLPFNVEMHYLLAMHLRGGPWAGMYVAQLMHLSFVALFVLAVYGFALELTTPPEQSHVSGQIPRSPGVPGEVKERGGAERAIARATPLPAMIAALAVATVPWVTQLAPVAYDEGGFLVFATLAIARTQQAIAGDGKRTGKLALAGVFAGLACGAKLTAVPEVLLPLAILAAILVAWKDRGKPLAALRAGGVLLATGLIAFSPWLVRNAAWVHNPIFPEAANLLGHGGFNPAQIERWQRAHSARPDQQAVGARLRAGWKEVVASPQYGFVIFPLAILGIWSGRRRPVTAMLAAMLLALTLIWLFATHLEGRFFILGLPICALLIAQIDRPAPMLFALGAMLVGAAISGSSLHRDIVGYLRGGVDSPLGAGISGILGAEDVGEFEADYLKDLPDSAQLVLIGDAKAFWYTIPMSRLRYHTVFDVPDDAGSNLINDWNGAAPPANARIVIDPGELTRFHDTYWKIAPPPDWVMRNAPRDAYGRPLPFVAGGAR